MRGIEIDPVNPTARVEAGVLWLEVVEAAARHGLAALAGSSPDVGVVGYTLGGGGPSDLARPLTAIHAVRPEPPAGRTARRHESARSAVASELPPHECGRGRGLFA